MQGHGQHGPISLKKEVVRYAKTSNVIASDLGDVNDLIPTDDLMLIAHDGAKSLNPLRVARTHLVLQTTIEAANLVNCLAVANSLSGYQGDTSNVGILRH